MDHKPEKNLKNTLVTIMLSISALGLAYLGWYHIVDGELIRTPLVFRMDEMNIAVEKDVYKPGDEVRGYFSFCKTRVAKGYLQVLLYNESITALPADKPIGLPVGCYPENGELALYTIGKIPHNATKGPHSMGGFQVEILPTGKEIRTPIRTEEFIVK